MLVLLCSLRLAEEGAGVQFRQTVRAGGRVPVGRAVHPGLPVGARGVGAGPPAGRLHRRGARRPRRRPALLPALLRPQRRSKGPRLQGTPPGSLQYTRARLGYVLPRNELSSWSSTRPTVEPETPTTRKCFVFFF